MFVFALLAPTAPVLTDNGFEGSVCSGKRAEPGLLLRSCVEQECVGIANPRRLQPCRIIPTISAPTQHKPEGKFRIEDLLELEKCLCILRAEARQEDRQVQLILHPWGGVGWLRPLTARA